MATAREHWERVYAEQEPDEVSWYEPVPASSLALIEKLDLDPEAPIVDVGAGASGLAAELWERGHRDLTVVDVSAAALERTRAEHPAGDRIAWILADIRDCDLGRRFALWHDRAVFHFMVDPDDRRRYLRTLHRSLEPQGEIVIATFGPEGPERCSGLPVHRYDAEKLAATIDRGHRVASSSLQTHRTPSGSAQQFLYAHLTRREGD